MSIRVSIDVTNDGKTALKELCEQMYMKQDRLLTQVIKWILAQDKMTQIAILHADDPHDARDLFQMILARCEAEIAARSVANRAASEAHAAEPAKKSSQNRRGRRKASRSA